jgi:hypothetical protein
MRVRVVFVALDPAAEDTGTVIPHFTPDTDA